MSEPKSPAERLAELEAFQPTTEQINALPAPLRRFITALETIADPACSIRDAIVWRETAEALAVRVRELEAEIDMGCAECGPAASS